MHNIDLRTNLDLAPWDDMDVSEFPLNTDGVSAEIERVGLLPNGTVDGRATVLMVVRLPDGTKVVAETTWRLFHMTLRGLAASPTAQAEEDS